MKCVVATMSSPLQIGLPHKEHRVLPEMRRAIFGQKTQDGQERARGSILLKDILFPYTAKAISLHSLGEVGPATTSGRTTFGPSNPDICPAWARAMARQCPAPAEDRPDKPG